MKAEVCFINNFIFLIMEMLQQYFSDFSKTQIRQFAALKDLYTGWNEKINVISRKDMDNFYEHHVLHSLTIATQKIKYWPPIKDKIKIATGNINLKKIYAAVYNI